MALSVYEDEINLDKSTKKNFLNAIAAISGGFPDVYATTICLFADEHNLMTAALQTSNIIISIQPAAINQELSQPRDVARVLSFQVAYKNLYNREQNIVINAIKDAFTPNLNFPFWDTGGDPNSANWTLVVPMYIRDFKENGGFNSEDGRYVRNYSIDLRYKRR